MSIPRYTAIESTDTSSMGGGPGAPPAGGPPAEARATSRASPDFPEAVGPTRATTGGPVSGSDRSSTVPSGLTGDRSTSGDRNAHTVRRGRRHLHQVSGEVM